MLTNGRSLILWNVFLIAAIGNIALPNAGGDLVLPNLSNLVGQVGNIVTSTLWKLKMRTYFNRFDFNKDGVIRRSDFQTIAKNFAAKEGFSPEDTDAAVNGFNDVFSIYTQTTGTNADVPLTVDLLTQSMAKVKDNVDLQNLAKDYLSRFVTPMKVEQAGYFTFPEFRRIYESSGFSDTGFTQAAFNQVDSDHDGKISREDFVKSAVAYMTSDDILSTVLLGLL